MENRNVFAENLQRLMEENGVTRRDLSDALKTSYFTITSWVKGQKYPRMDKVEMLANYFGVQKSDLIEERKQAEPAENDGISEKQKMLIDYAKSLSEEEAAMALRVLRSIVESD